MKTIIDSKIGLINIFNVDELDTLIDKREMLLNGKTLIPNGKTSLDGFFDEDVEYLGLYDGYMQFKIGEEVNLFNSSVWVSSFKKLTEQRIMTIYQAGTARDYNFKNGAWK
jgi:hypothetical protein